MHIIKLRDYTEKELGDDFNLKFHLQVLYQGSAPLSYLEEHINEYVKNKTNKGCDEILHPVQGGDGSFEEPMDSLAREIAKYFRVGHRTILNC